jgi:MFS family permease
VKNSSPSKNGKLWVIFLTIFIDLIGFSIIFPLFPSMLEYYLPKEGPDSNFGYLIAIIEGLSRKSGADTKFLTTVLFGGIIGSIYSLLQFIFSPILGHLSDRFGRRPILIFTIAGTTLSYLLWVFASSFNLLVFARIFGGIMGGNLAVATAAVADVTSDKERSKGMALVGVAFGLGFIIGPVIGGLSSLFDLTLIKPSWEGSGINPFSIPALFAFTLSLINLFWVIGKLPETFSPPSKVKEKTAQCNSGRLRTLFSIKNSNVRLVMIIYFIFIMAFSGLEFTITFLALERLDYGPPDNTKIFLFIGLVLIGVQGGLVRNLASRLGEKKLVMAGMVFGLIAFVCLAQASHWPLFYFGLGLLGFSVGFASPTLSALASLYSPKNDQGRNLGAFRSAGSLARAVGPLFFAFLYWYSGSNLAYITGAVILILPLVMGLGLIPPNNQTEASQETAH